jgi:hypothetical protein
MISYLIDLCKVSFPIVRIGPTALRQIVDLWRCKAGNLKDTGEYLMMLLCTDLLRSRFSDTIGRLQREGA